MEKVLKFGLMDLLIKGNIIKAINMEKENINGKMEENMMEIGIMTKYRDKGN